MKIKTIFIFLLMVVLCSSCVKTKKYNIDDYRTTMKFHDDFRVMQLTDLHLGIESDLAKQLKFICESIEEADPDLIVLTGDNFMFASKGIVTELFKTLNNKCKELSEKDENGYITKFAVTFGNHDNQGDYSRYYVNSAILKYVTEDGKELEDSKFAAFLDYENDDLHGFANYFIDLVDDPSKSKDEVDVKYRLHILDSNTYYFTGTDYDYDVIHNDQLEHINNIYNNATKDKDYIGMCFFHIPFYEFSIARDQYVNSSNKELIGQGEFNEDVNDSSKENESYIKLRKANIISYFVGHDHINYGDFIYNALNETIDDKSIFSYGVKSTNQLYHFDYMMGYKIINLKNNMTQEKFISIENVNQNFINVLNRGDDYE